MFRCIGFKGSLSGPPETGADAGWPCHWELAGGVAWQGRKSLSGEVAQMGGRQGPRPRLLGAATHT
ncbi:hypothetical protein DGo_CA1751 [Deinococcus gobiensis I-0]|uniref:Uncharacterized protein n=1 Tax=Deinococcus gobiensis (strain DSM 21396 / JCM 16679 / CGMCC 1.7299 / I-0) TaxID=745776 RepID=H8GWC8_DEIGI|nr:hypothetical protein DGo_CA1751 [Deinococcus gobiensis I-0]